MVRELFFRLYVCCQPQTRPAVRGDDPLQSGSSRYWSKISSFFLADSSLTVRRSEARCCSHSWDWKYRVQNSVSLI